MKNFGIALLTMAFVISSATMAQGPARGQMNGSARFAKNEMRQDMKQKITPKKRAGYMAVNYDLTDAQRAKLEVLFEKQDKQVEVHRAEMQKLREQQMGKRETMQKANANEMEKILGAEKFAELKAQQTQRTARMKNARNNKMRPNMQNNYRGMRRNDCPAMRNDSVK